MPNGAAARVDDQVKHSEAQEYRFWGALGATLASVAILGGLAALEIVTLGAATPLVIVGTVLVVGGTSAGIGSAVSNVAANEGRKVMGPDEGPIVNGINSILIGPEKKPIAHIGSYASCNRHKHGSPSTWQIIKTVAADIVEHGDLSGIAEAHEKYDGLEQIVQGSGTVFVGNARYPASRVGDKGTCGFLVGHGCETVIIGGPTVTNGTIGDGDDPDKGFTDAMGLWGGRAAMAGLFLLTLPAGLEVALLKTLVAYDIGEIQGKIVGLIPNPETRDKVNMALALIPIFHEGFKAARGTERGGAPEGGGASESGATSESGTGPTNGGATAPEAPAAANDNAAPAANDNAAPGTRAGSSETTPPAAEAPPAADPIHQISEAPGGVEGTAPPDQPAGGGSEPAETSAPAAEAADPLTQQGDSPGGNRAVDGEEGPRPDLTPEENFPGQQSGNNCAPQSCQQIIRQATGKNYSEAEMEEIAGRTGAYDPNNGTVAGGEAEILNEGGVPSHTQDGTPENIQKALDNGQGVVSGHDAAKLWPGDPNVPIDPNNPLESGGHAVHTTGLVRDSEGNVTHYTINDTGTGTAGRNVPAEQYERSLDRGPIAVTNDPIRTPTGPRPESAPAAEEPATAPETPATAPETPATAPETPATAPETPATAPEEAATPPADRAAATEDTADESTSKEVPAEDAAQKETPAAETPEAAKAGEGDPTVQTGDRPGGLRSADEEGGTERPGAETDPESNPEAEPAPGTRGSISRDRYKYLRRNTPSDDMKDAVNENAPATPYPDPVLPGREITTRLEADHIISMKTITEMNGFDQLTQENQLRVLNYPDNFVGLSKVANTSKGSLSYSDWTQYKKGGIAVDPTFRQNMIQKTQDLNTALPNYINTLLGQQQAGTP